MNRFTFAAVVLLAPAAFAQTTAEKLARGIKAYEEFNVEAARPLFAEIISPSYISPVSQAQKVTAYKYLGASWAVLTQLDSAQRYFIAALDFDPFTDLEVDKFTPAETGPFNTAKTQIFRIGMRPVLPRLVNPRVDSSSYRFTIVTTHSANVTLTLLQQNTPNATPEVLFQGRSDGQRAITWDGRMKAKGGVIADSGTYLLSLEATSTSSLPAMAGQKATETQLVRIEQSFDPLEDSLPELPGNLLLPAAIKTREPWMDLVKGTLVGAASFFLPAAILKDGSAKDDPWHWTPHAVVAVGIGLASGGASFLYRNANRAIDANVIENARRQNQRTRYNQGIASRNAARLGDMLLIVTPLSTR